MNPDEVELMSSSKSENEWNQNCDEIKKSHCGRYPSDWYIKIIASGLFDSTRLKFDLVR